MYDLPSWGRCELALSLLLEHSAPYSLEDVVQAVRESHDKEFIRRVLAQECPICLSVFPHSKVLDCLEWYLPLVPRFQEALWRFRAREKLFFWARSNSDFFNDEISIFLPI